MFMVIYFEVARWDFSFFESAWADGTGAEIIKVPLNATTQTPPPPPPPSTTTLKTIINSKVTTSEVPPKDPRCFVENYEGFCILEEINWVFDKAKNDCLMTSMGDCFDNKEIFYSLQECEFLCLGIKPDPEPMGAEDFIDPQRNNEDLAFPGLEQQQRFN